MNSEQFEKAEQLTKKIKDLKKNLDDANDFLNLLDARKGKEADSLYIRCNWSGWPEIGIKVEVAQVAMTLIIKKHEKELLQTEEEFKNL